MMKFSNPLYVENGEKMIYQLTDIELKENGLAYLYLELVCGYDYINPDNSNIQGYVDKSKFSDDIQHEIVSCDILAESMIQALNNDDFYVLKDVKNVLKGVIK